MTVISGVVMSGRGVVTHHLCGMVIGDGLLGLSDGVCHLLVADGMGLGRGCEVSAYELVLCLNDTLTISP